MVTAIALMTIMLGVALSSYAYVGTQQTQSKVERTRESSFNLAEGVLNAQVFTLSRKWPGTATAAYPASCTASSTDDRCPDATKMSENFSNPDFSSTGTTTWTTNVRDNASPALDFYSDSTTLGQPAWDANGDGQVWVRAEAVVRGRKRVLAALVRVESVLESLPRNVLTAGRFSTSNSGNKVIVDRKGSAAQAASLVVRCNDQSAPSTCTNYLPVKGQVSPPGVQYGYTGGNALSDDAIARLKEKAIADGTYYASGCPTNPSGAIVYIANGNCSWNNSAGTSFNSAAQPGVLIVETGTLSFTGNVTFYGIVYAQNKQSSSGSVVTVGGTATIRGGVSIDGDGAMDAGSSKANLIYDDNAFNAVTSYGTAGIVQNRWREVYGQ